MKFSTAISTIAIASLAAPSEAKVRGLVEDCTNGQQKCSSDDASIITCVHGWSSSQAVAPGTKCCDDVLIPGKVFMVFADMMCYEPCSEGAVEGQQICNPNEPSKYYQCTNGNIPGYFTPTEMTLPGGTACCVNPSEPTQILLVNAGEECPALD